MHRYYQKWFFVHRHLSNAWCNKSNSLIEKPHLAGNASDSKRFKILFKFYSPARPWVWLHSQWEIFFTMASGSFQTAMYFRSHLTIIASNVRRATWNTWEIHTLKFDHFYIFYLHLEARMHVEKVKLTWLNMIKSETWDFFGGHLFIFWATDTPSSDFWWLSPLGFESQSE